MAKCKCYNCGMIFDEDNIVYEEEDRGECWGVRSYEKIACSPCCGCSFEEVDEDEEDDEDGEEDEENVRV